MVFVEEDLDYNHRLDKCRSEDILGIVGIGHTVGFDNSG